MTASLQCAALSGDDTWLLPVQKKNDCWWFGETGRCHNFYILMAFVGVCTVADIVCLFVLNLSTDVEAGTNGNNLGVKWKNRYAVAASFLLFKI
jgi:hypothetical protein